MFKTQDMVECEQVIIPSGLNILSSDSTHFGVDLLCLSIPPVLPAVIHIQPLRGKIRFIYHPGFCVSFEFKSISV